MTTEGDGLSHWFLLLSSHAPCSCPDPALRVHPLRPVDSILRLPQSLAPLHAPEFLRHGAGRGWRVAPSLLGRSPLAHRRSCRAARPPGHLLLRPPPDARSRRVPRLGRPAPRSEEHTAELLSPMDL